MKKDDTQRTVVFDTNVLLDDPGALLSYPDAHVVVPDTVLAEIDKLKVSRVDPDLRFRGREVSRMLFELSETGNLMEGVELPDGGTLRVAPLEPDFVAPEGLQLRNPDDRILATAMAQCQAGCTHLTLVTNDLNMLLKAQTFGLNVERRADLNAGVGKRTMRWFQRYKTPITILAIAVAVFAGVLALALYTSKLADQPSKSAAIPTEFRDILSEPLRALLDNLIILESKPTDVPALKQVADAYYQLYVNSGDDGIAQKGIDYYSRYLERTSDDPDARTDMAVLYFYTGRADAAIQQIDTVLQTAPEHVKANFNLGIFYWKGRTDWASAARQFERVIDLTNDSKDATDQSINQQSRTNLQTIQAEAAAAGQTITIDPSYLSGGAL